METLKNIIRVMQNLSIASATIAFVICVIRIVADPDGKHKQIKIIKNILTATALIVVVFSLIELPKYYYGSNPQITDSQKSNMTFADIKDTDCQGRETVQIDGKWYVVTDSNVTIAATSESESFYYAKFAIAYMGNQTKLEGVSVLRLFNESQGTFKGFYAEIKYYRDKDGFIFPSSWSCSEYMNYDRGSV